MRGVANRARSGAKLGLSRHEEVVQAVMTRRHVAPTRLRDRRLSDCCPTCMGITSQVSEILHSKGSVLLSFRQVRSMTSTSTKCIMSLLHPLHLLPLWKRLNLGGEGGGYTGLHVRHYWGAVQPPKYEKYRTSPLLTPPEQPLYMDQGSLCS